MASHNPAARAEPQPAASPPGKAPVVVEMMQELQVSGHLMSLPAGLFCLLHEPENAVAGGLPGIRITLPPEGIGVEIAGFRADGWLAAAEAALVRVTRGPAQILVTIYQAKGGAAPKLQVRQLLGGSAGIAPPMPPAAPAKAEFMAHIQGAGDVGAPFGGWLGKQGSGKWIEGFAIAPPEGIDPADITYQAVLGRDWLSPWVEAGQYCGSRGMALPLLGFKVRLQGAAAQAYELSYTGRFVDGSVCGPQNADQVCESAQLVPLEAMSIVLKPRPRKPRSKR